MSSSPAIPNVRDASGSAPKPQAARPAHFYADLYTFDWTSLHFRLPAVSAAAVAFCLALSLALGSPAAGLISGGGALTVGFGANQRIADSRIWPMIFAIAATASATLAGTVAGHHSLWLIVASAVSAALYGVLTMRNSGLAWVGQQAACTLFVASAFPMPLHPALERTALIATGGFVQLLFTSAGLRLMPELRKDLLAIPRSLYTTLYAQRRELLLRLRELPNSLPAPDRKAALAYAFRLLLTVSLGSWVYIKLGIQSGYWVPMTALLVVKPAFFETLSRGLMRVIGTLAGATLATLVAAHLPMNAAVLAGLSIFFAFWCFATASVNYCLFTFCITSYIVFLLSLNQVPGPLIAERRAWCTALGAAIALVIHLDAMRRHREVKAV